MKGKILGINDDVPTYEGGGETHLKETVVLELPEAGQVHYGADCAAAALLGRKSSSNRKVVLDRAGAVKFLTDALTFGATPEQACKAVNRHPVYSGYGAHVSGGAIWVGDFFSVKL